MPLFQENSLQHGNIAHQGAAEPHEQKLLQGIGTLGVLTEASDVPWTTHVVEAAGSEHNNSLHSISASWMSNFPIHHLNQYTPVLMQWSISISV